MPSVFASHQHSPADTVAQQLQDEMTFIDVDTDVKVVPSTASDVLSSEPETAFTVQVKEIQRNLPLQTTLTVDALRGQPQAMKVVLLYYNNYDCEFLNFYNLKHLKF